MGMGRRRARARDGWPANLYPNRDGYKYRHPITRKETWMGIDRARAFAAAKKLNALLMPSNDLVARVTGANKTVTDAIAVFRTDDMPSRKWAAKTAAWYEVFINRIATDLGNRDLETLSVKDCAQYLRDVTDSARGRQTYRLVLCWILACAVEEGWIDNNPAEQTRKFAHTRQRARLTLEAYQAIHAHAPQWLRNAMDLSLLTLLRREDVVSARFSDDRDDALWIVPQKTENSTLLRLRIDITPDLRALISRCRDAVVSPYLIHRLPEKAKPSDKRAAARQHSTQVLPEQLTRAFATARTAAGITGAGAPTFHEIRSLGGALLMTQAGWTKEQVQQLMGHSDVAMTTLYLDGHELPWSEVRPGLTLTR